ncbi:RNA cytidine acetyltransferase isoform X2 [Planococcus citri]|uniref:RNA cytidine acetyltransferase isoform X2 n=1 Tax=Planococcus citri TaxID=170843 RepID=UPI0031F9872B
MVRKKIDNRIRVLIENGVVIGHRTLFIVVGDKGRDQVVILHHMLSKANVKARPNVLWCYKKELGFSSHRKNKMKNLQRKIKAGRVNVNDDDPFELFIASTTIRYCYYSETQKILGNTYGMCVLQDFEALTPNLLARTVETVEGGGIIVILLRSLTSLKQLYTMNMDVHERYRTDAHSDIVGRFNERFLLSLSSCDRCLVIDDQLTVLPIASKALNVEPVDKSNVLFESEEELVELKESLKDTQPVSCLVNCCKTIDQAKAVLKFVDAISEKTVSSTVSLTASRGRGKSAALGLAVAAAVAYGYSNIFVTSPSPENLNTFFQFVLKGFDALAYQEHLDYGIVQSTNPEYNKALVRINIFKDHRQTIQYIHPSDAQKLSHAELVVIDEAAAIPLPYVKSMLGPYLVFLSSTINGYEGTGRSLSLKLLQQLRNQTAPHSTNSDKTAQSTSGRSLHEIALNESIRYRNNDSIEKWLSDLLCLDATSVQPILSGCPPPEACDLYYINRDTLFCYHKASEAFLHRVVALFVASHYKNTPNDLQMMSDAPAHHLFCLLGPINVNSKSLPEVLCVVQICLEGQVSKSSISSGLARGKRASGDLIPWTVAQQFQDEEFPALAGARVVRIATHPDYQGMGYGKRALTLLKSYYEGQIVNLHDKTKLPEENIESVDDSSIGLLEERIEPRKHLPPLLLKLNERPAEVLDYIGVSYGVTAPLFKFWKKIDFVPVYLRQTANDLTGEYSCIMLSILNAGSDETNENQKWLSEFFTDFRRRFLSLLSFQFKTFHPSLALSIVTNNSVSDENRKSLSKEELLMYLTMHDIRRLEMYCRNLVDYHLIVDLVPTLAKLYFQNKLGDVHLSAAQAAILLGIGLQSKTVDNLTTELELVSSQLLGLFNRTIRRIVQYLDEVLEKAIELTFEESQVPEMKPLTETVDDDLEKVEKALKKKQKKELQKLKLENLEQYVVKGAEKDWNDALQKNAGIVSIKSNDVCVCNSTAVRKDN